MEKTLSTLILDQEKKIKSIRLMQDTKTIQQYLLYLKEDRYNKLLKCSDDRETHLLIGELRSYEKLLALMA